MRRFLVRLARRAIESACMIALAMAVIGCDRQPEPLAPPPDGWLEFAGSWNASGSRRVMRLGTDRRGSLIDLRGTMLLVGAGRPDVGFRAEVIALVDSETGLTGRSVWTDERGDEIYSKLTGAGTKEKNHVVGEILGGTGRYAGATGDFEFSWQFVLELDDGSMQGRATDLTGRIRPSQSTSGGAKR